MVSIEFFFLIESHNSYSENHRLPHVPSAAKYTLPPKVVDFKKIIPCVF